MKSKYIGVVFFAFFAIALVYAVVRVYLIESTPLNFSYRSKMYVLDRTSFLPCVRKSSSDFFLSMKEDGTGYIIITGTAACKDESNMIYKNNTINYTYTKEGGFYSLTLGARDPEIFRLAKLFKEDVIKIKITKTNSNDYIISTPLNPMMMCTSGND